ncbi:hypothetical protein Vi05172_g11666 [Venturia inaequalis]|nr:hypothetical protein Vi05172_g11666 [Venturia inaequalis]
MVRLPFALPVFATLFSSTLLSLVQAQIGGIGSTPLFSNTTCLTGPNTTFVNCNTFYSALVDCTSNTTQTVVVGCECQQSFFDLVVGCKSELRICSQNNTWDATFDPQIDDWHALCDASGVTVTTPVLAATSGAVSGLTGTASTTIASRSVGSATSTASTATASSSFGRRVLGMSRVGEEGMVVLMLILGIVVL